MPHKTKICTTALATHISDCDEMFTFAPLVIERSWKRGETMGQPVGLKSIRAAETAKIMEPKIEKAMKDVPSSDVLVKDFMRGHAASLEKLEEFSPGISRQLSEKLDVVLSDGVKAAEAGILQTVMETDPCCQEDAAKGSEAALEERLGTLDVGIAEEAILQQEFPAIALAKKWEMNSLGIFFTESLCFSCNGKTYDACGNEFTLLPGDEIIEKTSWSTSSDDTTTTTESTSSDSTTTVTDTRSTDFTTTYKDVKKKTTDVKFTPSLTLSGAGKLFKVIDLKTKLDLSGSYTFNKYLESTKSSTITDKKEFVNKVVNTLKASTSLKNVRTIKTSESFDYNRKLTNPTDQPIHYIERDAYCVYSVFHKRTDAHLAWSACLDNPGEGLCTPETFEEDHAEEIAEIISKWETASAPASLGPRPANVSICSETFSDSKWGNMLQGYTEFTPSVQIAIPADHSYIHGSAHVEMISHNSELHNHDVTSQPSDGATGNGTIGVRILVTNRRPSRREEISYRVCYEVRPDAAREWDDQLDRWRMEQAEAEIEALRASEAEKFNQFLLSDRARELLVRKLLEKYFAIDNIQDCCRLIARLERLFDFSKLSYRLLPSWNEQGEGCQKTEPVNLGNARCAHLYVPIKEGVEWEAILMLAAVNALDSWNPNVASQIAAYINQITQLRDTVFTPAFEVTDALIDQINSPQGLPMTPYDTDSTTWENPIEGSPGYILLDAYTVPVPCGQRTEMRPNLCG